ncbi:MAG: PP2C family protein-serine/threonine phosphatase [Isosphaeraceae bacterium]
MSHHEALEQHTLHCMEIWGGIEPVERSVSTPGLDLWVFSEPYRGEDRGGDVYYVTLCGGGLITRLVVADVSGHGRDVAEFSSRLRAMLRKNINQKSQKRLVESLNREFAEMAQLRRFATTVVLTFLASTGRLSISNAGHPRPLLFRAIEQRWSLLPEIDDERGSANLPLGLDEETRYYTFDLELARGDLVVLYTDALSETADPAGAMLGEGGLLESVRGLDMRDPSPATLGQALLEKVVRYRQTASAEDDATLLVLYHNDGGVRRLSLVEKLDVYAKVFGLKPV